MKWDNIDRLHFIGIGGISMSGIAKILIKQGYKVSGSDLKDSNLLDELRDMGALIHIGHSAEYAAGADMVVISSAIPETNPEYRYAKEDNIPILKRAEMIAKLMESQRSIAIAGTHGKTTTTSMTATILKECKVDPTVLVGGELNTIGGNAYLGDGDYLLTEADESDGSLLYFNPVIAVVTNIEMDHQDYYQTDSKLFNTFKTFLENLSDEGKAVVCKEDKTLMEIAAEVEAELITYGISTGDLQAVNPKLLPFGSYYDLVYKGKNVGEVNLQIPGRHNILNSLAAVAVAISVGVSIKEAVEGIKKYTGVHRRFEKKGLFENIMIIDDYAHHPTEIKATLKAAGNTGFDRIIAVFQPHRYTRTKFLMDEFVDSFEDIDHLIITEIYSAGEAPIPGVNAKDLALKVGRNNDFKVEYIAGLNDIVKYLEGIVKPKDLILTIGAGNVFEVGEKLLKNMKKNKEMA
ncbi:MAG: UDP-N-acetylmuramate--L-alanine ligase [Halothermotrichaceae bacterium]